MKIRFLAAVTVCALGALTLTGCDSKVGTAAVVDGHKISVSDLNGYLTPNAQPIQVSQNGSVSARTFVLETLVDSELIRRVLLDKKASVDANALAAAREKALPGVQDAAIDKQDDTSGLNRKFTDAYVTNIELKYLVQQAFRAGSGDQIDSAGLQSAVSKIGVRINPRYGSWDAKNLALTDLSKGQVPSFLHFDTTFPGDTPPSE